MSDRFSLEVFLGGASVEKPTSLEPEEEFILPPLPDIPGLISTKEAGTQTSVILPELIPAPKTTQETGIQTEMVLPALAPAGGELPMGKVLNMPWLGNTLPPPWFKSISETGVDTHILRNCRKGLGEIINKLKIALRDCEEVDLACKFRIQDIEGKKRVLKAGNCFSESEEELETDGEGTGAQAIETTREGGCLTKRGESLERATLTAKVIPGDQRWVIQGPMLHFREAANADRSRVPFPLPRPEFRPLATLAEVPQFEKAQALYSDYLTRVAKGAHYAHYPPQPEGNNQFTAYATTLCHYCGEESTPGRKSHFYTDCPVRKRHSARGETLYKLCYQCGFPGVLPKECPFKAKHPYRP